MGKGRLEAFSDGVIAVIITIMVLELKAPHGQDLAALAPLGPALLSYCLSFVYVGIYWNNHHHMLHAAQHIDGRVLWANLHLLFWLSLVPFTTSWVGERPAAAIPTAIYGSVFLMSGVAWLLLQRALLPCNALIEQPSCCSSSPRQSCAPKPDGRASPPIAWRASTASCSSTSIRDRSVGPSASCSRTVASSTGTPSAGSTRRRDAG